MRLMGTKEGRMVLWSMVLRLIMMMMLRALDKLSNWFKSKRLSSSEAEMIYVLLHLLVELLSILNS